MCDLHYREWEITMCLVYQTLDKQEIDTMRMVT